jgi:hemerythrin-like metal-binding protein
MADKHAPLGIVSLDEQHEALSCMLGAFQLAIAARQQQHEIRAIVDTALAAVRAHFQFEEALMAKSGYARACEHRFEHERMMLAVATLTHDALDCCYSPDVLNENGDLLRSLFYAHITHEDLALSRHLLGLGMG